MCWRLEQNFFRGLCCRFGFDGGVVFLRGGTRYKKEHDESSEKVNDEGRLEKIGYHAGVIVIGVQEAKMSFRAAKSME